MMRAFHSFTFRYILMVRRDAYHSLVYVYNRSLNCTFIHYVILSDGVVTTNILNIDIVSFFFKRVIKMSICPNTNATAASWNILLLVVTLPFVLLSYNKQVLSYRHGIEPSLYRNLRHALE